MSKIFRVSFPPIISPSILGLPSGREKSFLRDIFTFGAEYVHLDVVGADFVQREVESTSMAEFLRLALLANETVGLRLDIHLMVNNPWVWLKSIEKQVMPHVKFEPYVSIHVESRSSGEVKALMAEIERIGAFSGLAIKPETSIHDLNQCFDKKHQPKQIIVMTVNPGVSGQKMIVDCLKKVEALSGLPRSDGPMIEVDGGINLETAELAINSGAEILVSGGWVQEEPSRIKLLKELQKES